MKIKLAVLVTLLALGGSSLAQIGQIQNPVTAPLNVQDAGTCSTANSFVIQQLPQNASTTTLNLAGTFSATITVRESNNGGATWTSAGTTLSSAGTTTYSTNGFSHFCVDITAYTSGTVLVSISTGILQVQSVVSGVGGGITSVATLAALPCTNGTTVYLNTATTALATGNYLCNNGVWTLQLVSNNNTFAASFGVTAAGSEDCTATFTNGSGTVTLSANAMTPTASMVGWSMQGSVGCQDAIAMTAVMPRCTITSVNAGARTLTGTGCTANANAAGTATQHVTFGPIEDTQLTAAAAAAFGVNSGPCGTLQLPTGFVYLTKGNLNTFTCNTKTTGPNSTGAQINGWNRLGSRLGMSSDFDFTTCPSFSGKNTCFGGAFGVTKMNFSVTGFQNPGTNPAAATTILNDGQDDFTFNVGLFGYGASLANLTAFTCSDVGTTDWLIIEDAMGQVGLGASGTNCQFVEEYFGNNSQAAIFATGSILATSQGGFGPVGGASPGIVQITGASSSWMSNADILLPTASINELVCNLGSLCNINSMRQASAVTGTGNLFAVTSGAGHWAVSNSSTAVSGTGFTWNLGTATALADDMGGNTIANAVGKAALLTAGSSLRRIIPTSTYTNPPGPGLASCASAAAPAVCSQWLDGAVVVAAAGTTVTVNTTAVTADSEIVLTEDSSLGTKLTVTCNVTPATALTVTARTPGTSFVITTNAPAANPRCISFAIR